jgi:hypothetical protein
MQLQQTVVWDRRSKKMTLNDAADYVTDPETFYPAQ